MKMLHKYLDSLGVWTVDYEIKINPSKSKAVRFTRARVKEKLNYSLVATLIPEASSCKNLGIILRSDLICVPWMAQGQWVVNPPASPPGM
jgi:hypothetical protein